MPSNDLLVLGGNEIANNARTTAYAQSGIKPHTMKVGGCDCPGLAAMLGDAPYTNPVDDDAPWYDPAVPASANFAGLLITSIDGLRVAPVQRSRTDRVGPGAVIGRRRLGPRTIVVRGVLIGSSCCGIEYGMRWLTAALDGGLGCSSSAATCAADDLCYLVCCPSCEVADETCLADHYRTLKDVAMIAEPTVISEIGGACPCGNGCDCCSECPALEVEFTLLAGKPWAFKPAVTLAQDLEWTEPPDECITWVTALPCSDDYETCEAAELDPCPLDPRCPPTEAPSIPVPDNPCNCIPLAGYAKVCVQVPAGSSPLWSDAVPIITLTSGPVTPLRGVRIRVYGNPLNLPAASLEPCDYCGEINISYIPPGATYILDGTTQRTRIQCVGRAETSGSSVTFGEQGGPLEWPVLECGSGYTICIEADAATVEDATVTVQTVVRER